MERLFTATFSDSEGEAEGSAVGSLAGELLRTTEPADIRGFVARADGDLPAGILFSRLRFERAIEAFLLAPVAVRTDCQCRGLGRSRIRYGLTLLQQDGVELVLTYGDPCF